MRRPARLVFLFLLSLAVAQLLTSCRDQTATLYLCKNPCKECVDPCCDRGRCVPTPPSGWEGPVLLWTGSPDYKEVVLCPDDAPNRVYEGYAGLSSNLTCPDCACEPAPCQFGGVAASDSSQCQPGSPEVSIPPPDAWSGACVPVPSIPAADVGSVRFLAPTVGQCQPVAGPVPQKELFDFAQMGIACAGAPHPGGCGEAEVCAPVDGRDLVGYRVCLFKRGELAECPDDFPEQQIFAQDFDPSTAGCTECACGAPQGAACIAEVAVYEQAGCMGGSVPGSVSLGSAQCLENQPNIPIGAMGAAWTANQPGTCEPVPSVPFGEPTLIEPSTFCCRL